MSATIFCHNDNQTRFPILKACLPKVGYGNSFGKAERLCAVDFLDIHLLGKVSG